jgi:site-specific DNA-methyltransferase (adenine-specific)
MNKIPDRSVDMVMTDPPYGTTACKWDSIIPLEPMWEHLKRVIKPNGAIVMTASQPFTTTLIASNMKMFSYCWVWEKSKPIGHLNANRKPMNKHEDIVVFSAKQPTYNPQGLKDIKPRKITRTNKGSIYGKQAGVGSVQKKTGYPRSIIQFQSQNGELHPTQKPVALMEYLIKTYTNEGETVLDFTMGSGTTGVACVNQKREFIGIEMDDKYFDIATKRIEESANRLF